MLFGQGCPVCGWVSPQKMPEKSNAEENILHVDVIEEDDFICITFELPLFNENNIKFDVNGNRRVIEKTYRNGVLEVKLLKTGG